MPQIGDILVKIGKQQPLTPEEELSVRLWGNQSQGNNAYISGLQNGGSDLSVNRVSANIVSVGKEYVSGLGARFYVSNVTIPNNSETVITGWTAVYNDGFTLSDTNSIINVPISGIYGLSFYGDFAANATGYRSITTFGPATANWPKDIKLATGTSVTYLSSYYEDGVNALADVFVKAFQNSGGDLALNVLYLTLRLLRHDYNIAIPS